MFLRKLQMNPIQPVGCGYSTLPNASWLDVSACYLAGQPPPISRRRCHSAMPPYG
jgi:hypothetical protein